MSGSYTVDLSTLDWNCLINNSCQNNSSTIQVNAVDQSNIENNLMFEEWPIATIVSICFVGLSFLVLTILKCMYSSADQFSNNANKYDLILFKAAPTNKHGSGEGKGVNRKMFENNAVRLHNLKALTDSGFDMNTIQIFPRSMSGMRRGGSMYGGGMTGASGNRRMDYGKSNG